MMRAKRPRSLHTSASASHGNGHGGHARTRSMSDDNLGDDHLLHMDPSLMTERQQLAFLLRKTAQEQSGADSPETHSSESSDDDVKRPKKRIQRASSDAKTSPRKKTKQSAPTPRSRPPKGATQPLTSDAPTTKTSPRNSVKLSAKRLHVKTLCPTPTNGDAFASNAVGALVADTKASIRKPSPSSTSDIAHMGVFDEPLGHTEFWSLHCALCSASASHVDTSCEPLFLCQSCDKKYPTQRALGRV